MLEPETDILTNNVSIKRDNHLFLNVWYISAQNGTTVSSIIYIMVVDMTPANIKWNKELLIIENYSNKPSCGYNSFI